MMHGQKNIRLYNFRFLSYPVLAVGW